MEVLTSKQLASNRALASNQLASNWVLASNIVTSDIPEKIPGKIMHTSTILQR